jgi:hypothetical protein
MLIRFLANLMLYLVLTARAVAVSGSLRVLLERGDIDHEALLYVALEHPFVCLVELLHRDHLK